MDQILAWVNLYGDKAIAILGYIAGLGVVDFLLRKFPTDKPKSIAIMVKGILHDVIAILTKLDQVIDALPFMKQNLKDDGSNS